VWDEALRQAGDMLQSWTKRGAEGTRDTVSDTATLSLHVLTGAGFGISYAYGKGVQHPPGGHTISYRDALLTILQNVLLLSIIPRRWMAFRFAPAKLRRLGQATREFQTYMAEMFSNERSQVSTRQSESKGLLTALVRALEEAREPGHDEMSRQGLIDDEIFGNIFIYNLAGYETTANTIATGIVLLAAYPEWQEWLAEEIKLVFNDEETSPHGKYDEAFPRLSRCLAVMVCFVTDLNPLNP
jgi:cytochrome P450